MFTKRQPERCFSFGGLGLAVAIVAVVPAARAESERITIPKEMLASTLSVRFSVVAKQKVEYTFAASEAGEILASVSIKGAPVNVTLRQLRSGKVRLTQTIAKRGDLRLQLSGEDVAAGMLWALKIDGTGETSGNVNITHPRVDESRLTDEVSRKIEQQHQDLSGRAAATQAAFDAQVRGKLEGYAKARRDAIAVANAKLTDLAKPGLARLTVPPIAKRKPSLAPPGGAGPSPSGALGAVDPSLDAVASMPLSSATPAPGQVQLTASRVQSAVDANEAWFTIGKYSDGSDITAQGRILSATVAGSSVNFLAEVPFDGMALTPCSGMAFLRDKTSGKTTNGKPFVYRMPIMPSISTVNPAAAGPSEWLTVDGTGFTPHDQFVLVRQDGKEAGMGVTFITSTKVKLRVPLYTATDGETAYFYPSILVRGQYYRLDTARAISLAATVPNVSNIESSPEGAKPGSLIKINGKGFLSGTEVHLLLNNQDQVLALNGAFSTDQQLLAMLPDFKGIVGPTNTVLYVKSSQGRSQNTNITLSPGLETKEFLNDAVTRDYGGARLVNSAAAWTFPNGAQGLPSCAGDDCFAVHAGNMLIASFHRGGVVSGASDNDIYYRTHKLANGWKVKDVLLSKTVTPGEADAYVEESRPGTDSPYVRVHWWNSPVNDHVYYNFKIIIEGPAGTNP